MSDRQIRAAQRTLAQDPDNPQLGANLLRAMIQGGQVEAELIRQIASLGDPVGLILFPGEEQLAVKEFLRSLEKDKIFCVEFAVYCARKVLPIWEASFPGDDRPRLAIEAAENWLSDPTEENAHYAGAAASAAAAAARANAADAASAAADAAASAWANDYVVYAGDAATTAAWAAERSAGITDKELLIDFLTKDVRIR